MRICRAKEHFTVQLKNHVRISHYEQSTEKAGSWSSGIPTASWPCARPRKNASEPSIEYLQIPNKSVSFSLGEAGKRKVFQAPTLWHLALAHPEECKLHLFPLLAGFFPCCQELLLSADQVEGHLLSEAATNVIPSRERLAELIRQLGDDHFAKREAADRQLRGLGAWVSWPLRQLDFHQLDAEQQVRIQHIINAFFGPAAGFSGQEIYAGQPLNLTPGQVAVWLAGDPATWLAVLERPEESRRRTAARQLAALLGEPIAVDPAADPATQTRQREQLRAKIEKTDWEEPSTQQEPPPLGP